jgi:hypothetical protein
MSTTAKIRYSRTRHEIAADAAADDLIISLADGIVEASERRPDS